MKLKNLWALSLLLLAQAPVRTLSAVKGTGAYVPPHKRGGGDVRRPGEFYFGDVLADASHDSRQTGRTQAIRKAMNEGNERPVEVSAEPVLLLPRKELGPQHQREIVAFIHYNLASRSTGERRSVESIVSRVRRHFSGIKRGGDNNIWKQISFYPQSQTVRTIRALVENAVASNPAATQSSSSRGNQGPLSLEVSVPKHLRRMGAHVGERDESAPITVSVPDQDEVITLGPRKPALGGIMDKFARDLAKQREEDSERKLTPEEQAREQSRDAVARLFTSKKQESHSSERPLIEEVDEEPVSQPVTRLRRKKSRKEFKPMSPAQLRAHQARHIPGPPPLDSVEAAMSRPVLRRGRKSRKPVSGAMPPDIFAEGSEDKQTETQAHKMGGAMHGSVYKTLGFNTPKAPAESTSDQEVHVDAPEQPVVAPAPAVAPVVNPVVNREEPVQEQPAIAPKEASAPATGQKVSNTKYNRYLMGAGAAAGIGGGALMALIIQHYRLPKHKRHLSWWSKIKRSVGLGRRSHASRAVAAA